MQIDTARTHPSRLLTPFAVHATATATTSAAIHEPIPMLGDQTRARWARDAELAQRDCFPLDAALQQALTTRAIAYRTSFVMPGFGRFDIAVRDEPLRVAIRLHCHTESGYVWLCSKRHALEQRLACAWGLAVSVHVSRAGPP